jgi:hypothetical protein
MMKTAKGSREKGKMIMLCARGQCGVELNPT